MGITWFSAPFRVELTEHISRFLIKSRKMCLPQDPLQLQLLGAKGLAAYFALGSEAFAGKVSMDVFTYFGESCGLWGVRLFLSGDISILRKIRCNQRALLDFGRILATFGFHAKVKGCKFLWHLFFLRIWITFSTSAHSKWNNKKQPQFWTMIPRSAGKTPSKSSKIT